MTIIIIKQKLKITRILHANTPTSGGGGTTSRTYFLFIPFVSFHDLNRKITDHPENKQRHHNVEFDVSAEGSAV